MIISSWQNVALHFFTVDPNSGALYTPLRAGDFGVLNDGAGDVRFFQNTDGTSAGWVEIPGVPTFAYDTVMTTPRLVITDHPGGAAEADIGPLPARANGWKLVNAWVRANGNIAGTATVLDGTGGNAMTNPMVPGDANAIEVAAAIIQAQEDVAGGATPVWSSIAGTPAYQGYTMWVGL